MIQASNRERCIMDEQLQLSRRERQIMDIIYARGKATATGVLQDMADPPSRESVRTLLRILEGKGHLRHHKVGREFVYGPCDRCGRRPSGAGSRAQHVLRRLDRTGRGFTSLGARPERLGCGTQPAGQPDPPGKGEGEIMSIIDIELVAARPGDAVAAGPGGFVSEGPDPAGRGDGRRPDQCARRQRPPGRRSGAGRWRGFWHCRFSPWHCPAGACCRSGPGSNCRRLRLPPSQQDPLSSRKEILGQPSP